MTIRSVIRCGPLALVVAVGGRTGRRPGSPGPPWPPASPDRCNGGDHVQTGCSWRNGISPRDLQSATSAFHPLRRPAVGRQHLPGSRGWTPGPSAQNTARAAHPRRSTGCRPARLAQAGAYSPRRRPGRRSPGCPPPFIGVDRRHDGGAGQRVAPSRSARRGNTRSSNVAGDRVADDDGRRSARRPELEPLAKVIRSGHRVVLLETRNQLPAPAEPAHHPRRRCTRCRTCRTAPAPRAGSRGGGISTPAGAPRWSPAAAAAMVAGPSNWITCSRWLQAPASHHSCSGVCAQNA